MHICQSLDRSSDSDFTSQLSETSKKKDLTSSMRTCDLCKLTFPSPSVLDNHLKGSKHTRKVKSQQAFRQLQDNGTNLRQNIIHEDGTFEEDLHFGEISCEVCEVSEVFKVLRFEAFEVLIKVSLTWGIDKGLIKV